MLLVSTSRNDCTMGLMPITDVKLGKILGGGGVAEIAKIDATICHNLGSVYEKLQATRAKVAPVNLIYGSHFSATEATYKMSQNMGNCVEFTRTFTRITHEPVPV